MNFTEEQLARWAAPPSQSEQDRMTNAERAIRTAIGKSDKLANRTIRVFAQGSYRNRVNVRGDSDVDIAVACSDTIFLQGLNGRSLQDVDLEPATYEFDRFRAEVGEALIDHFGATAIAAGDKAFDVSENTYRIEADVAPFFDHRRYYADGSWDEGVEMRTRAGQKIVNWPEQHYANGVAKNDRTGRSYKGCVRILKTLRCAMIEDDIQSAKNATSFLMECLVWNVPDANLGWSTWQSTLRDSLAYLFNNTINDNDCAEWREVSELKYLFRGEKPWTTRSAHQFLSDCWDYAGYE